jgi:hypothetical protein
MVPMRERARELDYREGAEQLRLLPVADEREKVAVREFQLVRELRCA